MDYVAFGLILDDVPLPDGDVARGVLGGGGVQTAFGMRLWAQRVGLVARVGADLPEAAWAWLREAGVDTAGVRVTAHPTLRATQTITADGRRGHSWLVPGPAIAAQLARAVDDLPEDYRAAKGWHVGLHPDTPDLDFLAGLRALGGTLSVEPFKPADAPLSPEARRALLSAGQVFSPNLAEAASLFGAAPDLDAAPALARRLLDEGAPVVALRLGAAGSLVMERERGRMARVPAVPVRVVDSVGAGNAYCGGFLVGWVETGDVAEAGRRGAVAASLVLEQVGVPVVTDAVRAEARRRLALLQGESHHKDTKSRR